MLQRLTNSLFVSLVNVSLIAITFIFLILPRFTQCAAITALLILVLAVVDIILVIWDLRRRDTRARAVLAAMLWLAIPLLFAYVNQWEGPLYVAVKANPPRFQIRGAASFCGMEIYSPQASSKVNESAEPVWSIQHASQHYPIEASFIYGEVPAKFVQKEPLGKGTPVPLDPEVTYTIIIERCMGGPQEFSLTGTALVPHQSE